MSRFDPQMRQISSHIQSCHPEREDTGSAIVAPLPLGMTSLINYLRAAGTFALSGAALGIVVTRPPVAA